MYIIEITFAKQFLIKKNRVLLTLFPNDQYPTIEKGKKHIAMMRYDATTPFHMGLDDEPLGVDGMVPYNDARNNN